MHRGFFRLSVTRSGLPQVLQKALSFPVVASPSQTPLRASSWASLCRELAHICGQGPAPASFGDTCGRQEYSRAL